GHYFVQVDGNATTAGFGDRSQFSVWPTGYTNHPHMDIGEPPTATFAESNRWVRMAPGFTRCAYAWSQICSNAAGTNDWTTIDRQLHGGPCPYTTMYGNNGGENCMPATPAPVQVLCIGVDHYNSFWTNYSTASYSSPEVDETNTLNNWVHDVATVFSNAAVRYTNSFVYEIMNEPDGAITISNVFTPVITFSADQDPYDTSTSVGYYPISLAVSASVQAIQFACPTCQTWAPAVNGLRTDPAVLTDVFARAGYTKVNNFSYHQGDTVYGAADASLSYQGLAAPSTESNLENVAAIYGKPFAITEAYPWTPDPLGKTSSWWVTVSQTEVPLATWTWQTMTFRFWKDFIMSRANGLTNQQTWLQLVDYNINAQSSQNMGNEGQDAYCGWDVGGEPWDIQGCGPLPTVDGQAMISWWLTGAIPVTNWLSGSSLTVTNPAGGYIGTPGLHFWTWQFANGGTNTFVWSDEQITVSTNFGVGLTDIFSNEWAGPIGIEPVIAWGWPEQ
ncbi:MAG: hypothetical protein ABSD58_13565, partial [Verrucomicrobiia bacterium]